jgi:hypothetical protein
MCVLIFSTTFVWNISRSKKKWVRCDKKMYIDLHVKYPFFWSVLMKLEFSQQIFEKSSNIKFHDNPSSGSLVLCGWMDRRTDMMKLIVTFQNCEHTLWISIMDVHGLEGKGSWRENFWQVSEHRCWHELSHSRLHLPEICCAPAVKLISQSLEVLTSRL